MFCASSRISSASKEWDIIITRTTYIAFLSFSLSLSRLADMQIKKNLETRMRSERLGNEPDSISRGAAHNKANQFELDKDSE